jgi:hypothetical protein
VKQRDIAIVVAALIVAAIFTLDYYRVGFPRLSPETDSLVRVAQAEETSFKKYRHGSNAEGTQALLSVTQLLQKEEARWRDTSNGRIFAIDLGLTYGRLALLAEAVGATDKRDQYFDLARVWLAKNGHDSGNEQQIRIFVAHADESGDRGEILDSNQRTNAAP